MCSTFLPQDSMRAPLYNTPNSNHLAFCRQMPSQLLNGSTEAASNTWHEHSSTALNDLIIHAGNDCGSHSE
jgi:hypothetical protein